MRFVRVFLTLPFPSSVISSLIRRLRGVLHLLTYEQESSNIGSNDVKKELKRALTKGCSDFEVIEPTDILDSFAAVLAKSTDANSRKFDLECGGFFYLLAVASLSRNLILSILYHSSNSGMREAMRRRLMSLREEAFNSILSIAGQYLRRLKTQDRSEDDFDNLISILFDTCVHRTSINSVDGDFFVPRSDYDWSAFLMEMSKF